MKRLGKLLGVVLLLFGLPLMGASALTWATDLMADLTKAGSAGSFAVHPRLDWQLEYDLMPLPVGIVAVATGGSLLLCVYRRRLQQLWPRWQRGDSLDQKARKLLGLGTAQTTDLVEVTAGRLLALIGCAIALAFVFLNSWAFYETIYSAESLSVGLMLPRPVSMLVPRPPHFEWITHALMLLVSLAGMRLAVYGFSGIAASGGIVDPAGIGTNRSSTPAPAL